MGSSESAATPSTMRDRLSLSLRSIGLIGIATIAIMRCVIFFAPQVLFDVDPAHNPAPIGGLGPAGSLLLDALLLGACACGLLGQAIAGRKFDALLLVLAAAPAPIVLWHGAGDAGDLWRGSTWLSAALACAVVAHLVADRAQRLLLIALLAAVLVPLIARGVMQVPFVGTEYADTVAAYEANRDQFLADRGWEPESAAARIYERRLRQPALRGWFATTNILASLLAFAMIFFGGLTIASVRARLTSGYTGLLAIAALVAAAGLALSGSKGAILAALGGLVVLLAPLVLARAKTVLGRFGGAIAIACVVAALLAVCARALLLSEGFAGEKSLLFRWHYLVGSAGVFAEQPWVGVGPDGFQDAYVAVRVPRSPEEVASAHSVFADWLSTLGVAGGAWVVLTLLLLWRVGCTWRRETDHEGALPVRRLVRTTFLGAAVIAALGLVPAVLIELHTIDEVGPLVMRTIGLAGFIAVAVITMYVLARSDPRLADWSLAAAVIALLVHAQIEMTLFQPGAVVWAMCVLGVAGGAARRAGPWVGYVAASAVVLAATYLGAAGVAPARGQQRLINDAAVALYPLSEDRCEQLGQRTRAIGLLEDAYERWPANVLPLQVAVRQAVLGAVAASGPDRVAFLQRAAELADRAVADHGTTGSYVLRANLRYQIARLDDDQASWELALADARELTLRDPHGIGSWRRLGDVLWEKGDRADAVVAYERALQADSSFALDELKQLGPTDRQLLRDRIGEVGEGSDPSCPLIQGPGADRRYYLRPCCTPPIPTSAMS